MPWRISTIKFSCPEAKIIITYNSQTSRFEALETHRPEWKQNYLLIKSAGFKFDRTDKIWHTKTRGIAAKLASLTDEAAKAKIGQKLLDNPPPLVLWDESESKKALAKQQTAEEIYAWLRSRGWYTVDWNDWKDPQSGEITDALEAAVIQRERDEKMFVVF